MNNLETSIDLPNNSTLFYETKNKNDFEINIKVIELAYPILDKFLVLSNNIEFVLTDDPKCQFGIYYPDTNSVWLYGKNSFVLETLCHELVHVEQINNGTLIPLYKDNEKLSESIWMDKKIIHSHMAYNNLPWEEEANIRMGLLSDMVLDKSPEVSELYQLFLKERKNKIRNFSVDNAYNGYYITNTN